MKSFWEVEKEFDRKHDRAVLAFLLHFLPPPKLDGHFVDECAKKTLAHISCNHNTKKISPDTNTTEPQFPKDIDDAA